MNNNLWENADLNFEKPAYEVFTQKCHDLNQAIPYLTEVDEELMELRRLVGVTDRPRVGGISIFTPFSFYKQLGELEGLVEQGKVKDSSPIIIAGKEISLTDFNKDLNESINQAQIQMESKYTDVRVTITHMYAQGFTYLTTEVQKLYDEFKPEIIENNKLSPEQRLHQRLSLKQIGASIPYTYVNVYFYRFEN